MRICWKFREFAILLVIYFQFGICDANNCAITHECAWWEFDCGNGNCVNIMNFCDGIIDCPNASDEVYVSDTSTGCSNIQNNFTHTCELPPQYFCDSITHCNGKYDEEVQRCKGVDKYQMRCDKYGHCANKLFLNCSLRDDWSCSDKILCREDVCTRRGNSNNQVTDESSECDSIPIFRCDDGACLEADKFCDGTIDCADGSDEIMELAQGDKGIMCSNAWNSVALVCRLSASLMCDGIDHCDQRIDECQDGCERSFICDNGKCIYNITSVPLLCNGMDDCGDSSDECGANLSCPKQHNVFTCDDGSCLAIEKFCDGRIDCPDGSDEITSASDADSIVCKNNLNTIQLKCLLPKHHVCDQSRHCADNSDELHCDDSRWFKCANNNSVDSTTQVCNFKDECCDSSDECGVPGCNKTFHCVTSGECIAFERFCDGTVDCKDGSDEDGTSGPMCNNAHNSELRQCRLPELYVCDGLEHCVERVDECSSNCSRSFFCDNGQCLGRSVLCDGIVDCLDGSDEVSSHGLGFKCAVARTSRDVIHMCDIPQSLISDGVYECRDQSDACNEPGKCFKCATTHFYVAINQVCDGVINCPDASDECLCGGDETNWINEVCDSICLSKHDESCKKCRQYQVSCDDGSTCYDISQSCDGTVDCEDGLDERNCPIDIGSKQSKKKSRPDFICNVTPGSYEFTYATKCDGIPECTNFEDECAVVDGKASSLVASTAPINNTQFVCGEKTPEFCKTLFDPITQWFHCPGQRHLILFPQDICDGMEDCQRGDGEEYSPDEQNCMERIKCNSSEPMQKGKITIHVSMLCDGIIDCVGEEDEAIGLCNEPSRFYCENRGPQKQGPLFVSQKEVFDGKDDCWDGSDECPTAWFDKNLFSSQHEMIKNVLLSCMVWIMAILALFGNFLVVWHTSARSQTVRRISNMMKSNYLLVCNLAAADFLMGIYLLALAVKNSSSSGRYCRVDREWRSSTACSVLGSLAMVSIQSSVMFLLILTTYRVVAVIRPFKAEFCGRGEFYGYHLPVLTKNYLRYTFLLIVTAWATAILIAVIPHSGGLEDYFVSSAWLSSGVYFFATNTQTKNSLLQFARRQWNLLVGMAVITETINQSYPKSWNDLNLLTNLVTTAPIVQCVGYSTIILTFDFFAFIYIVTSYVIIYYDATRITATRNNRLEASEENKTMQTRITRLVVTDFACWVPVCILAFLSLLGVDLEPITYAIAAIVLLPINSALNPILYSNMLTILYSCCIDPLFSMHTKHRMASPRHTSALHKLFCCRCRCCSHTDDSLATSNDVLQLYGRIRHMSSNESTISKTALSTTATTRA